MIITIEKLPFSELVTYLRQQADDAFPDLKDEQRLNMLAEKWCSHAAFCTCRNDENRLVGMIAFYANQPGSGVAFIPHVYVSNGYRGQNLMSSMLNTIKENVKENGFRYFRLEVHITNKRAQRAYLHYGFSFSGDATDKSVFMQYRIS